MPYTPTLEDLPDPTPAQREGAFERYTAEQARVMALHIGPVLDEWLEENKGG